MSRKLALACAPLLGFTLFAILLAAPSWATHSPASPSSADAAGEPTLFFSEDFEAGTFESMGWTVITLNQQAASTWQVLSGTEYAHSGQRGAVILGDTEKQDEKLLAPPTLIPEGDVELVFWAKIPDISAFTSGKDVELWLVRGEAEFSVLSDDVRLEAFLDDQITTSGVWTELRYRLSSYRNNTVQVAWRYDAQGAGDFYLDDVRIERQEARFETPYNYVSAPYKVEAGQWMTYVLVVSNTGSITSADTSVLDILPTGSVIEHSAGTAQVALVGTGIISSAFIDSSSSVEWQGDIPPAAGLIISIPVRVVGDPGDLVNNNVSIASEDMIQAVDLAAQARIQPPGTLFYYESFNQGPGDGWQSAGWAWGAPPSPPDSAHSWPGAWGTQQSGVLTRAVDLTSIPPTRTVFLQWWELFERGDVSGSLAINGNTVYQISSERADWTELEMNVTPYAGQAITLSWTLSSAGNGTAGGGWYIDDVALHVYTPTAGFAGSWMQVDRTKINAGDLVTYTFYISNSGSASSTKGYMRDQLPTGMSVYTVSLDGAGVLTPGLDFIEWSTSDERAMSQGDDATITVVVSATQTKNCGQSLYNSALIAEAGGRSATYLQAPPVSIYPGDVHYASQFDDDAGGALASGRIETPGGIEFFSGTAALEGWGWGQLAAYSPGPAWEGQAFHSAPRVWGTYLSGDAPPITGVYTLTLPALDLRQALSLPLALQWWEWYKADDEDHAGVVLVSGSDSPTPLEVYRVAGEQAGGWQHHSVDLSAWGGQDDVRVSFVYNTDGDQHSGPGWYIDSLALHDDCPRFSARMVGRQTKTACRGAEIVYQLSMFNWNNATTTVRVQTDWPGPPIFYQVLPAGLTTTVPITVFVPAIGDETVYAPEIDLIIQDKTLGIPDVHLYITASATITAHWQEMAPLPASLAWHAVVAQDDAPFDQTHGMLYVIGGSSDVAGAQAVSTTWRYDPATDVWSKVANMPFRLSHVDGAALNGEIYVPGGQTTGGVYTNTTLVYSPTQDAWRAIPASAGDPGPAAGYAAVAHEGQLVRLGGYLSPGAATDQVWAYDPASGGWSLLPPLQDPRAGLSAGAEGGAIYVAGGASGTGQVTTTEVYSGGNWTYGAAVPTGGGLDRWAYQGDAMLDGRLYLVGGERSDDTLDHSANYSPTLDAWTTPPDLPRLIQPRRDLEADVLSGTIYAVGGRDAASLYAANERLVFCPVCNAVITVTMTYTWNPSFNPTEPERIVDGQPITFTVTGFQPSTATRPIEFSWNWDDGSPWGSGRELTHVYTSANPLRSETDPDVYHVYVTATNCSLQQPSANALLDVHSVPVYSMTLGEYRPIKDGLPGDSIDHVAHVFNRGTRADGYNVEISGGYLWTPTLLIPSNGLLPVVYPYNTSRLVMVNVQIPLEAQQGEYDTFTLTVTSFENPGRFKQVVFWTGYFWSSYLPLVTKQ